VTYEEILAYFQVNKRYQDKAQCKCPAHDDKQASLTVTKGRDSVLIYCHAGCGIDNVLSAAGLKKSDLFYQEKRTGSSWQAYIENWEKKKIEAVYNYVSINGGFAFTKVRMQGKKMIYGTLANERFTYGLGGRTRKELCAVYVPNGVQAMEQLYLQVKGFIHTVAWGYRGVGELEDLEQEGYLALYPAIDRYDPERGIKFLTYAEQWIRQRIQRYIRNNGSCLRIPVHRWEKMRRYEKFVSVYAARYGREPSDWAISVNLDCTMEQVEHIQEDICKVRMGSLDSPITGLEGGEDGTVGDTVPSGENLEENTLEEMQQEEVMTTGSAGGLRKPLRGTFRFRL